MQRVETVNRILAEPTIAAPAQNRADLKEGKPQAAALLVVVQVVLCLLIFIGIYLFQRLAPEQFALLKEQYAPILDQALLLQDGEVNILYEE